MLIKLSDEHWLAGPRSISYFSPDVRTPIKLSNAFYSSSDWSAEKNLSILGWSFFFFFPPFILHNCLPGTRAWTSSNWRTNPKRSHEVLNGRNRESVAQTPARWERGRKQRCSNASVQHRLKKKKLIDSQKAAFALRN